MATGELFAAIAFCSGLVLDCFADYYFGCLKFSDVAVVGWEGSGVADDVRVAVDGGGSAGAAGVAIVVGALADRLGGRAGYDV